MKYLHRHRPVDDLPDEDVHRGGRVDENRSQKCQQSAQIIDYQSDTC